MKISKGIIAMIIIGYLGLFCSILIYMKSQDKTSAEGVGHVYGWGWLAIGTLVIAIAIPPKRANCASEMPGNWPEKMPVTLATLFAPRA